MSKEKSIAEIVAQFDAYSPGDSIELPTGAGAITIESAEDRVSIRAELLDITRDAHGLAVAEALASVLAKAIAVLKADQAAGSLPKTLTILKPTERDNPFA